MIADPSERGRALANFFQSVAPRLYHDLEESGLLRGVGNTAAAREWECFALYACVRGLVAAAGFNRETAGAIDAMHEAVLASWIGDDGAIGPFESRRALVSERYAEYGAIGQEGGKAGAATVTARLGMAAARHMTAPREPAAELAAIVGALHETLAEGAAESVRRG